MSIAIEVLTRKAQSGVGSSYWYLSYPSVVSCGILSPGYLVQHRLLLKDLGIVFGSVSTSARMIAQPGLKVPGFVDLNDDLLHRRPDSFFTWTLSLPGRSNICFRFHFGHLVPRLIFNDLSQPIEWCMVFHIPRSAMAQCILAASSCFSSCFSGWGGGWPLGNARTCPLRFLLRALIIAVGQGDRKDHG